MHAPSPTPSPLPVSVAADLDLFVKVRALIAARPTTWETVIEHLGAPVPDSPYDRSGDYGYGVRSHYSRHHGACTTVRVFAVSLDGALARLKVSVDASANTDFARGVVAAVWGGVTPDPREQVTAYDQCAPRLIDAMHASIEATLGGAPRPTLSPDLDVALDALLSPFAQNGVYLRPFGYSAETAPDPFKPLIDAERYDAIRCLLRAPVPAVRARAAVLLDGRDDLDDADRRAIAVIESEGLVFVSPAGCVYYPCTAASMLEERRLYAAAARRRDARTTLERLRDEVPWGWVAGLVAFGSALALMAAVSPQRP